MHRSMQQVNQPPSFCSVLLSNQDGEQKAEEDDVKWTATVVFLSSSDTVCDRTSIVLSTHTNVLSADRSHRVYVLARHLTSPGSSS